jgi:hypothetical protein
MLSAIIYGAFASSRTVSATAKAYQFVWAIDTLTLVGAERSWGQVVLVSEPRGEGWRGGIAPVMHREQRDKLPCSACSPAPPRRDPAAGGGGHGDRRQGRSVL